MNPEESQLCPELLDRFVLDVYVNVSCDVDAHGLHARHFAFRHRSGPLRSEPGDVRRAIRQGREGKLGDLRCLRFMLDGCPESHGRGQRSHPVAAARRLPKVLHGRGDHLRSALSEIASSADIVSVYLLYSG